MSEITLSRKGIPQKKFVVNNGATTRDMPVEERFWSKVAKADVGCWEWLAAISGSGYGLFWLDGRYVGAHRVAVEFDGRKIPTGMHTDHLCSNRSCVRPDHLEVVTPQENQRRSTSVSGLNAAKVECAHGHPLSGDNLYLWRGHRHCRTCVNERNRKYRRG